LDPRVLVETLWRGEGGTAGTVASIGLAPAEGIFRAGARIRNLAWDRGWLTSLAVGIPVISIGNLSVGGSGKTPLAAWTAARMRMLGRNPAIVLRGYGEDEVAVHRELNPEVPVHRGRDRVAAIVEASRAGADCAVVDDGFQHRRLRRDLDLVLVSAEQWRAPRHLLPRGPWREPADSLQRASHVIVTRKSATRNDADQVRDEVKRIAPGVRVSIVHLAPDAFFDLNDGASRQRPLAELAGARVVAVSTLADPRPFLAQLRQAGARVESITFGDHHEFTDGEVDRIAARFAGSLGVMTRKEAVKLRGRLPPGVPALVVEQRVIFEEGEEELVNAMDRATERNG